MKLGCARRSFLGAGLFAGFVAACASEPPRDTRVGEKSQALFSNGGFESGTLAGWTLTTYSNTAAGLPRDPAVSPPQTLADLGLVGGGWASSTARTGASEAQVPWGLIDASPSSTLRYPKYGSWTGVVNEGGNYRNANSLKQSSVTTSADVDPLDGRVHVRFALAPVLQNPGHTAREQPYFFVIVRNRSKGGTIFSTFNFANQPGVPWMAVTDAGGEQVLYTHWQSFDVAPASDELAVGDRVELEVVAVGCARGGHYGEVYVDAFGSSLPGLSISKTSPVQANPGADLTYAFTARNNGDSAATSVVVTETLPAGTTFVSADAPGASCAGPAIDGTGTLVCSLASLDAGAAYRFSVTVHVDEGATGKISNGNYSIRASDVSPLLGPLVETNTVCAVDADCATGFFCASGACNAKRADGSPCGAGHQCLNGICADGACCDRACDGACEACDWPGKLGVCSPAPAGSPGDPACAPFLCDGSAIACPTSCASNRLCAAGFYCTDGACAAWKANGASCTAAEQCASGHCVDGVCCNSACLGQCEACDLPGKAGACSPATGAPHGLRAACASDGSACGGTCDGAARAGCAYPGASAQCRAPSCETGVAVLAAGCDGQGACPAAQVQACAPLTCGRSACRGECTDSSHCQAGSFCSGGVCQPKWERAESCAGDEQCATGRCADGVCCDGPCLGQCEACDAVGQEGTCGVVAGAPRGGRPACAGAGLCQGQCGGELADRCIYPGADATCSPDTCEDGVRRARASCDGQGRCGDSTAADCGGFACSGLDCRTSCAWDADCAPKAVCVNGACHKLAPSALAMAGGCRCGAGAGESGTWLAALAAASRTRRRV
jgi:uncharacterized repeat protein (TIGR01451 family)